MKIRHNKKRNTAFLFETLVLELTKALMDKSQARAQQIQELFRSSFSPSTALFQEMQCYKALTSRVGLDRYTAEKLLFMTKEKHKKIDQRRVFQEQSSVIKSINRSLGKGVYNNFIADYKSYATIAQIFATKTPLQKQVLLEKKVLEKLEATPLEQQKMQAPDSLVVSAFIERYNEKYADLLPEQKMLLSQYISCLGESAAEFKVYLGEELKRIYTAVTDSLTLQEVQEDPAMLEASRKVLEDMNRMNVSSVSDKELLKVLKLQKLVSEYKD